MFFSTNTEHYIQNYRGFNQLSYNWSVKYEFYLEPFKHLLGDENPNGYR